MAAAALLTLSAAPVLAQAGTAGPSNSPPLVNSPGGPGVVVVDPMMPRSGEVPGNAGTAGPSNSPPLAYPSTTGTVIVAPPASGMDAAVTPGRSGQVPGAAGTAGPSNSPPLAAQPR
jgi:hypothetical protein